MNEITVYKASRYSTEIQEKEVVRITEKSIFLYNYRKKEVRENRFGNSYAIFETREEAVIWLKALLEGAVATAKSSVDYHQRQLNLFLIKNP